MPRPRVRVDRSPVQESAPSAGNSDALAYLLAIIIGVDVSEATGIGLIAAG